MRGQRRKHTTYLLSSFTHKPIYLVISKRVYYNRINAVKYITFSKQATHTQHIPPVATCSALPWFKLRLNPSKYHKMKTNEKNEQLNFLLENDLTDGPGERVNEPRG